MTTRAGLLAIAALCAGCGGTPEPQQTSPMTRPGPNAVAPVSPADRLRVGSATWTQPAPAEAPVAAAPAAAADTSTPAPSAPSPSEPAAPVAVPAAPAADVAAQPAPVAAPVAAPVTPSLYDRLGGAAAVAIVVDTFTARVHGDTMLAPLFRGVDMDNFKRLMRELICQETGGGCTYTGRSMAAAHQGLNVTDTQFEMVLGYLGATLDTFKVPAQEKNELLTALGGMKGDIVGH
jgi:hemoglobin